MATSLAIIDPRVADYESLLSGLPPETEVLILELERDGVEQIQTYLDGRSGYDALHIFSHGAEGTLYLGGTVLTSSNLGSYATALQLIGQSLTPDGDILLYGCNVAQGEVGQQFIQSLAQYTGADVAASSDLTGLATLGGDWQLEVNAGPIEATTVDASNFSLTLSGTDSPNYDIGLMADLAETANAAYDYNFVGQIIQGWTVINTLNP